MIVVKYDHEPIAVTSRDLLKMTFQASLKKANISQLSVHKSFHDLNFDSTCFVYLFFFCSTSEIMRFSIFLCLYNPTNQVTISNLFTRSTKICFSSTWFRHGQIINMDLYPYPIGEISVKKETFCSFVTNLLQLNENAYSSFEVFLNSRP